MAFIDAETVVLAVLLFFAAGHDLYEQRIPNWLSGTVLVTGCLFSLFDGYAGLLGAAVGTAIGLAAFLPFYLRAAMGAGDVKLMAATGAFTGFHALWAVGLSLIAGALLAVVYFAGTRLVGPGFGGVSNGSRFPYAAAIAVGGVGTMVGFGGS